MMHLKVKVHCVSCVYHTILRLRAAITRREQRGNDQWEVLIDEDTENEVEIELLTMTIQCRAT